jgi:hypothetical protein
MKGGGSNSRPRKDSGIWRNASGAYELVSFAAVRMDGEDSGSQECIAPEEILYAFTQGAVRRAGNDRRHPGILAAWTTKFAFPEGAVFLRTRSGIYRSYLRTLHEFKEKVPTARFDMVSQSVVANLCAVHSISLGRESTKTLSYLVDEIEISWPVELVLVGRDFVKRIRLRFGIPPRFRAPS